MPNAIFGVLRPRCAVRSDWLTYHGLPLWQFDNLESLVQEVFDPNHPATTIMTATSSARSRYTAPLPALRTIHDGLSPTLGIHHLSQRPLYFRIPWWDYKWEKGNHYQTIIKIMDIGYLWRSEEELVGLSLLPSSQTTVHTTSPLFPRGATACSVTDHTVVHANCSFPNNGNVS